MEQEIPFWVWEKICQGTGNVVETGVYFSFYKKYEIDVGEYGIFWNDEIDLSCNALWNNGVSYEN